MTELITGTDHYNKVLAKVADVRHSLWIGTADIKDLHVQAMGTTLPFVAILAQLIRRRVEVRLIHAKEPGPNFRTDFDRYPILFKGLQRHLCPRVHFKILLFDNTTAYIGSANLTGAGMGMKGGGTRNFEAGILTNDVALVQQAFNQYNEVWSGNACVLCKRKKYCPDPIA